MARDRGTEAEDLTSEEALHHSALAFLWHVARADGVVNDHEIAELNSIALELSLPVQAESLFFSEVGPEAFVARLTSPTGADEGVHARIRGGIMAWARRVALADGDLAPEEASAINSLAIALSLPEPF
jgi:tellurite resistance protein